jgi:hypothetical protein
MEKWYITTGVERENGAVLRGYGPYATKEEALSERTKLEAQTHATYWVENLPDWLAHPNPSPDASDGGGEK